MPPRPPAALPRAPRPSAAARRGGRSLHAAQAGFTLVEMVAVMILLAILAAVAVPRLGGALALSGSAWRDQVLAALLQARTLAQGHRRLVCVAVASGEVRLTQAAANPATSCSHGVKGLDGDARWARDSQGLAISLSPAGTLYMQPDGRITSDGAGSAPVNASITIAGEAAITVTGETGHVR